MAMIFNPDSSRYYAGFHMPSEMLAEIDQARIERRQSRSEFLRQAVRAYLFSLKIDMSEFTAMSPAKRIDSARPLEKSN